MKKQFIILFIFVVFCIGFILGQQFDAVGNLVANEAGAENHMICIEKELKYITFFSIGQTGIRVSYKVPECFNGLGLKATEAGVGTSGQTVVIKYMK